MPSKLSVNFRCCKAKVANDFIDIFLDNGLWWSHVHLTNICLVKENYFSVDSRRNRLRHPMLHSSPPPTVRLRHVWPRILLCQDISAPAHVWPLRIFHSSRKKRKSHNIVPRLLCLGHAEGGDHQNLIMTKHVTIIFRISVFLQMMDWNIVGALQEIFAMLQSQDVTIPQQFNILFLL